MFKYYNANPLGLNVSDCAVRAYSLALGILLTKNYQKKQEYKVILLLR